MRFTCLLKSARFICSLTERFALSLRYQSSNRIDANLVGTRTVFRKRNLFSAHLPKLKTIRSKSRASTGPHKNIRVEFIVFGDLITIGNDFSFDQPTGSLIITASMNNDS